MYLTSLGQDHSPGISPDDAGFGFGNAITATKSRTGQECRAQERRISPVVEPSSSQLVTVDPRFGRGKRLHRDAYAAYQRLKAAAEADGLPAGLLTIVSGYRSVASQQRLWQDALRKYGSSRGARRWVAPPGGSSHHTGRAVDFYLGGRNNSENAANLRRTNAYRWLVCNAARFGFFPYAMEPWHWEYNPVQSPTGAERPTPSGDNVQLATVKLQNALQKRQQALRTLSNISRRMHDTMEASIRKIRS